MKNLERTNQKSVRVNALHCLWKGLLVNSNLYQSYENQQAPLYAGAPPGPVFDTSALQEKVTPVLLNNVVT